MQTIPSSEIPDYLIDVVYGADVSRAADSVIEQHVIIDPQSNDATLIERLNPEYFGSGAVSSAKLESELRFAGVRRRTGKIALRHLLRPPVSVEKGDRIVLRNGRGKKRLTVPVTQDKHDIFQELGED